MIYWLGYFFMQTVSFLFCPRKISGRENLPLDTNFIIAGNHLSNLDPFMIGISSGRRLSYMAKESLFKNKLLAFFLKEVDAFPLRRDQADLGAMKETLRRLKAGQPVVVFPEGTRKGSATQQKVEPGVGFLVVKSGLPVVPVYVKDTDKVLPPGQKFPTRHAIEIRFGKALYFSQTKDYLQIAQDIHKNIYALAD